MTREYNSYVITCPITCDKESGDLSGFHDYAYRRKTKKKFSLHKVLTVLGPTHHPIQWATGILSRKENGGALRRPLTYTMIKNTWSLPVCLHGTMLI
jgi:hypothetical protein